MVSEATKAYRRDWARRNRKKRTAYTLAYRARNPDKVKAYQKAYRLRKTCEAQGVNYNDVLAMYEAQGGACLLCGEKFGTKRLSLDHDHTTGKFRGLLCIRCNTGLGMLQDNPHLLRKAAEYVEGNR